MAETVDGLESLAKLEARILETVAQLRAARQEKEQAQTETRTLREEVVRLRGERRQILERVEKLLAQIDTLAGG